MNGLIMTTSNKSKTFGKQVKIKHNSPKPVGNSKGSPEKEVHSNTGLPKKDRNISNKQGNLIYKNWRNNNKEAQGK